jgi:hypothetical protein
VGQMFQEQVQWGDDPTIIEGQDQRLSPQTVAYLQNLFTEPMMTSHCNHYSALVRAYQDLKRREGNPHAQPQTEGGSARTFTGPHEATMTIHRPFGRWMNPSQLGEIRAFFQKAKWTPGDLGL